MSTAALTSTSFIGMDIEISRTAKWESRVQENVAGKETRISYRTIPRWNWEVKFNFLRNNNPGLAQNNTVEFANFTAFYNNRAGAFDSFQWQDPEDNSVLGQSLGVGTGVASGYQLVRSLGGFTENIFAPSTVTAVYVDSTSVGFTVTNWGSSIPGQITFSTLSPTSTQNLSADFQYYWPVHFDADTMVYERMVNRIWAIKKVSFTSII